MGSKRHWRQGLQGPATDLLPVAFSRENPCGNRDEEEDTKYNQPYHICSPDQGHSTPDHPIAGPYVRSIKDYAESARTNSDRETAMES